MNQLRSIGAAHRKRYVEELGFIRSTEQFFSRSTNYARTIQSAQNYILGLFPEILEYVSPSLHVCCCGVPSLYLLSLSLICDLHHLLRCLSSPPYYNMVASCSHNNRREETNAQYLSILPLEEETMLGSSECARRVHAGKEQSKTFYRKYEKEATKLSDILEQNCGVQREHARRAGLYSHLFDVLNCRRSHSLPLPSGIDSSVVGKKQDDCLNILSSRNTN